ncbi:hypothetical protein C8R47DRAFT_1083460 [Mycena vitilis]|nr:hypothetical protein C8R47DRAFT_1083460 [Mycena vitilis]
MFRLVRYQSAFTQRLGHASGISGLCWIANSNNAKRQALAASRSGRRSLRFEDIGGEERRVEKPVAWEFHQQTVYKWATARRREGKVKGEMGGESKGHISHAGVCCQTSRHRARAVRPLFFFCEFAGEIKDTMYRSFHSATIPMGIGRCQNNIILWVPASCQLPSATSPYPAAISGYGSGIWGYSAQPALPELLSTGRRLPGLSVLHNLRDLVCWVQEIAARCGDEFWMILRGLTAVLGPRTDQKVRLRHAVQFRLAEDRGGQRKHIVCAKCALAKRSTRVHMTFAYMRSDKLFVT